MLALRLRARRMARSSRGWERIAVDARTRMTARRADVVRLPVVGLLVVVALVLTPGRAAAASKLWLVCPSGCDFSSVSSAVSSPMVNANDGIAVQAGTYTGQVD